MRIETQELSLDTLAVTIQALHVKGKQMTLAVFRQLPQTEEVAGAEMWGTVRYNIKDEGALWLVFSQNGQLYRRPLLRYEHEHRVWCMAPSAKKDLERHTMSALFLKGNHAWKQKLLALESNVVAMEAEDVKTQQAAVKKLATERELEATLPQLFIAV